MTRSALRASPPPEVFIPKRAIILAAVAVAVAIPLGLLALLGAADAGAFDRNLPGLASKLAGRPIAADRIQTHLLSAHPSLVAEGVRVGGPAWDAPQPMLTAKRIALTLRWSGVFSRERLVAAAEIVEPAARLVRSASGEENWKSGKDKGDPLTGVDRLSVTGGRVSFDDRKKAMLLSGSVSHDPDPANRMPFALLARGTIKGEEVLIAARGGRLNGRARRSPYPFAAAIRDGDTELEARGHTDKPLSLKGFDLRVSARGPNLAVAEYLLAEGLPNSAPFRLSGRVVRKGKTTRATGLRGVIGKSDFTGGVVSDGSGKRRLVTIELASKTLHAEDVAILLAKRPTHRLARSTTGAVMIKKGGPLLTDRPLDLTRFRHRDYALKLSAERFVVGGVLPGRLTASGRIDRGVFDLRPILLQFPSGRFDGALGLDVNGTYPAVSLSGRLSDRRLGALIPSLGESLNGEGELRVRVAGAGPSWRAIGRNAKGRVALTVKNGEMGKAKASFLSGAIVSGAMTALLNKDARTPLYCAISELAIGEGRVRSRRTLLVTGSGVARADGAVDIGSDTIRAVVHGRPTRSQLIPIKKPVLIEGPMLDPKAQLGRKDAPPPLVELPKPKETEKPAYCAALAAEALRFAPG